MTYPAWARCVWVILLIVLPYIGIFAYIVSQGRGMAERTKEQARQARDELRQAVGFSAADEIEKLDRLKSAKSISEDEYERLRARLLHLAGQPREEIQRSSRGPRPSCLHDRTPTWSGWQDSRR